MKKSFSAFILILLLIASAFALDRPPEAIDEGEPDCGSGYVDTYNGGCTTDGSVVVVEPGDVIWGATGVFGASDTLDHDWYQISLLGPCQLTWVVQTEFDVNICILNADAGCLSPDTIVSASTSPDGYAVASVWVPGGNFWLSVSPDASVPCGTNYAAWVSATQLEILSFSSDLPNTDESGDPDYFANYGQTHDLSIEITNPSIYASHHATVHVYGNADGATTFHYSRGVGELPPGDTTEIVFSVTEGYSSVVDTIIVDFGAINGSIDAAFALNHIVGDESLFVEVQQPAELVVDTFKLEPTFNPNDPYVTKDLPFQLAAYIHNDGEATISDLELNMSNMSYYGIESTIDTLTLYPGIMLEGGADTVLILDCVADDNVGPEGVEDERFDIVFTGTSLNDNLPVMVDHVVDSHFIGIQEPPALSVYSIITETWLNANNFMDIQIGVDNEHGDYATADELDLHDAFLTLHASEVGGVNGLDTPNAIFPTTVIEENDTTKYSFVINSIGATHNAENVELRFSAEFHDANTEAMTLAATSPLTWSLEDAFGIDILPPIIRVTEPIAGADWSPLGRVRFNVTDNLSGVDTVKYFIKRIIFDDFWNGATWVPDTQWNYADWESGNIWRDNMFAAPNPATWEFKIVAYATDVAGNLSSPWITPMGSFVKYVRAEDCFSDLHRDIMRSPFDSTAVYGYEYEADYDQTHIVTCGIYNPDTVTYYNVDVRLNSLYEYNTVITPIFSQFPTIPADSTVYALFEVQELSSSVEDSLFLSLQEGWWFTSTGDTMPIGLQIVDNDIRVLVQEPVTFTIESLWTDPDDCPVGFGPESTFVSRSAPWGGVRPTFTMKALVRKTGEDNIDSLYVDLFNEPYNSSGCISTIHDDDFAFYAGDIDGYDTLEFEITADTGDRGNVNKRADEHFWMEVTMAKVDNRAGLMDGDFAYSDTNEFIGIQEPPELDFNDIDYSAPWLNADNTVACTLKIDNDFLSAEGNDVATADRIHEYTGIDHHGFLLLSSTAGWGTQVGDVNYELIEAESNDSLRVGEDGLLVWNFSWGGGAITETEVVWARCSLWFHDQNYTNQINTAFSPEVYTSSTGLIRIDVTDTDIEDIWVSGDIDPYYPGYEYYREFPDSISARVTDNLSGVDRVEMAIFNHTGSHYNWDDDEWYVSTVDTFWQEMIDWDGDTVYTVDLLGPRDNGRYTVLVRAWDVAGNFTETYSEFEFMFDDECPQTEILAPTTGFFTLDDGLNDWDRVVEIRAKDLPPLSLMDYPDAAVGVRTVHCAIRDTLRNKWWDGSVGAWISSATWHWNECTMIDDSTWRYTGYSDMTTSAVLEFWSFARDSAGRSCAPDGYRGYIVIDTQDPEVHISGLEYCQFSHSTWDSILYGSVTDSITSVDSTYFSFQNAETSLWWDGTAFSNPTQTWLSGGLANPRDSVVHGYYFSGWTYNFPDPFFPGDAGVVNMFVMGHDDLGHTDIDSDVFCIDNEQPMVEDIFPVYGSTITYAYWDDHDTIWVRVHEDFGCPCDMTPQVEISIRYDEIGAIWIVPPFGDPRWVTLPDTAHIWHDMAQFDDSTWFYTHNRMTMEEGHYTADVFVRDGVGNENDDQLRFTISSTNNYLVCDLETPYIYTVGEEFDLTVTAFSTIGDIDEGFVYPLTFSSSNPAEVNVPGSSYLSDGTGTFTCSADAPGRYNIIVIPHPSTDYDTTYTVFFDVIEPLEFTEGAVSIDDVPDDQGDLLSMVFQPIDHDFALSTYELYRDVNTGPGETWVDVPYVVTAVHGDPTDPDSLEIEFDNDDTYETYDYGLVAELEVGGYGGELYVTDPYVVRYENILDNVTPNAVTNLEIALDGADIVLTWTPVTEGTSVSHGVLAERNPERDLQYTVEVMTELYDGAITSYNVTNNAVVNENTWTHAGVAGNNVNYFYNVIVTDADGNTSADCAQWVGKVDYQLDEGWNLASWPFYLGTLDINGTDVTLDSLKSWKEYVENATPAAITGGVYYDPTAGGLGNWTIDYVTFPFGDAAMSDLDCSFAGEIDASENVTLIGQIPMDETLVSFDFEASRNTFVMPLHREDITNAPELFNELNTGITTNSVMLLQGDSWYQYVDGLPFFHFDVLPGHTYMASFNEPGTWPDYSRQSANIVEETGLDIPAPCLIYGQIDDNVQLTASMPTSERIAEVHIEDGYFAVQVADFGDKWQSRDVVYLTVSDLNAGTTSEIEVELTGAIAIDLGKVTSSDRQELPTEYRLLANNPNPFNASTRITYTLPEDADVELAVYDINGKAIKNLENGAKVAGTHSMVWNGTDESGTVVPAGIYFYSIKAGEFESTQRMMLVK